MAPGPDLADVLAGVHRRIDRAKAAPLNEQNTKATLIEPVLRALGWDTEDVDEVAREYREERADNPVDYALLVLREPKLLLEAKALGEDLDDRRWAGQIMSYAAVAGAEWIVLTNGDEYRIYNPHASVRVDQKLLIAVRVSSSSPVVEQVLRLLARDQLETNRIASLWQAHFVDRQVRAGLERLFSREDDMVLVNHLLRHTKDLTAEDVRRSLRRCKVTLDFPLLPDEVLRSERPNQKTRKSAPKAARTAAVSAVTLLQIIEAGILRPPVPLTCRYKGKNLSARIEASGAVTFGGASHGSPSAAACAARASVIGRRPDGSPPATNGWAFWRYTSPEGRVMPLDLARQSFAARKVGAPA